MKFFTKFNKYIKESTHYQDDKQDFDILSGDPSSGIRCSKH